MNSRIEAVERHLGVDLSVTKAQSPCSKQRSKIQPCKFISWLRSSMSKMHIHSYGFGATCPKFIWTHMVSEHHVKKMWSLRASEQYVKKSHECTWLQSIMSKNHTILHCFGASWPKALRVRMASEYHVKKPHESRCSKSYQVVSTQFDNVYSQEQCC